MIEKLHETRSPNKYTNKVFNYKREFLPTESESLEELIEFHSDCKDYAIGYSGDAFVSFHFPATDRGRTIYRTLKPDDWVMGVGICIVRMRPK